MMSMIMIRPGLQLMISSPERSKEVGTDLLLQSTYENLFEHTNQ